MSIPCVYCSPIFECWAKGGKCKREKPHYERHTGEVETPEFLLAEHIICDLFASVPTAAKLISDFVEKARAADCEQAAATFGHWKQRAEIAEARVQGLLVRREENA